MSQDFSESAQVAAAGTPNNAIAGQQADTNNNITSKNSAEVPGELDGPEHATIDTYKFANELLVKLEACESVSVTERDGAYAVEVDLGGGWAGDYAGGLWGDVSITDDVLTFKTKVTDDVYDDEDEYRVSEGVVALHYADFSNTGLAYTSELEEAINRAVAQRTKGALFCHGSEQGMQGMKSADECYLSLDVEESRSQRYARSFTQARAALGAPFNATAVQQSGMSNATKNKSAAEIPGETASQKLSSRYNFANELLFKLEACESVSVTERDGAYAVEVDLGGGWAGDYAGGLWGDVSITDDVLTFKTKVTDDVYDDEDEYRVSEGVVALHYADFSNTGLAYTSELEEAINRAVAQRTKGALFCHGSEQGMQGMKSADECYLSLDVEVEGGMLR